MDPLTTISLVANIVAFVDWGTKVVRGTREIYGSATGTLPGNQAQETLVRETHGFITRLRIPNGTAEEEKSLVLLADECCCLAHAILDKLQSIKPSKPHSKLSAFWSALKSDGEQDELSVLEARLDQCRNQLSLQMNVMTR